MKLLTTFNKQTTLRPLRNDRLSLMVTCYLIAVFSLTGISAAPHTWQGANGIWGANDNWETAATDAGVNVVFNNTTVTNTNNINNSSIIGIAFGNGGGAFNLNGNTLTFGLATGMVNNNKANIQTVSLAITLTGAMPFTTMANGQTVITGALSGAGGLSVTGGGILSLNGPDRYSGVTNLAAGSGAVNTGGTLGGDGAITDNVTIGSGAIVDVGHGGTKDRNIFIGGSVTSLGTMTFRVGGEAAACLDALTVGSVDLVNTTLDFTFTDNSITVMTDATQACAFLSNPTCYTTSTVYQIISGTTTNTFSNTNAMDTSLLMILGLIWPDIP
jgi:hypothetical protein